MKTGMIQGPAIEQVIAATRGNSLFKSLNDSQLREAVSQATLVQLEPGESLRISPTGISIWPSLAVSLSWMSMMRSMF